MGGWGVWGGVSKSLWLEGFEPGSSLKRAQGSIGRAANRQTAVRASNRRRPLCWLDARPLNHGVLLCTPGSQMFLFVVRN